MNELGWKPINVIKKLAANSGNQFNLINSQMNLSLIAGNQTEMNLAWIDLSFIWFQNWSRNSFGNIITV